MSVRTQFEEELGSLQGSVLRMGGLVESAIKESIAALIARDRERAERIIVADSRLNDLHVSVREEIFTVIATQQPVARDLRLVLGIQYIGAELERIGDYAVRIAKRVLQLVDHPQQEPLVELSRLADLVERQVHDILDALVKLDAAAATEIAARDAQVDRTYNRIFGEEISAMMSRPEMPCRRSSSSMSLTPSNALVTA